MKKKILTSLIILIPGLIFILFYIKNALTKLSEFDIFDVSIDYEEEEF